MIARSLLLGSEPTNASPRPLLPTRKIGLWLTRVWTRPPLWLLLAALIGIFFARRPDAFLHPQFWAEDGVFFYDNYVSGLSAVFSPYNGYLHLVPRLIAIVGSGFDPRWIPGCYAYLSLALTLSLALRTQSRRLPFATNAGYALAVALVPDAPDGLMNPTNLQFILVGGLILLLLSRDPANSWELFHDVGVTLILGLTGPFSIVLAPFFLLRAWTRKTRASWILASIVILTGCLQLWLVILHPLPTSSAFETPSAWAYLFPTLGARVGGSLFAGVLFPRHPSLLGLNLAGIGVVIAVAILAFRRGAYRAERSVLGACCLLFVTSALYRQRADLPPMMAFGYGSRYFYAPQLLTLWLLLLNLSLRHWMAVPIKIGLGIFLLVNVPRLREPALQDFHWDDYVSRIRAGDAVVIPINPEWKIPLPRRGPDSLQPR